MSKDSMKAPTTRRVWAQRILRAVLPSWRSLRMAAYATFAFGILAVAAARSVYADVREMGLGIGHQLAKLEDLTASAYSIRVNGAVLQRSSAHTSQSTREVLDRYEAYCRENPGALARAMQDIPRSLQERIDLPKASPLRASIIRDEANGRGMVVCFVDDPSRSEQPFLERLRALADTGDLSSLGRFRYAFAEPSKSPSGGTHVVTFWSDGALSLKTMFPSTGDVPGDDSAIAPRPVNSRRTLSASVAGYPASVRIYEAPGDMEGVARFYDESLLAKGFHKVERALPSAKGVGYLRADNAEIVLAFAQRDNRTTVTMVEASAAPTRGIRVEEE